MTHHSHPDAAPSIRPMPAPGEAPSDIPRRIRAAARDEPGKAVLIDGARVIEAAALVEAMDRTAAALAADGLARGDVIATLAGVSADHLILLLGAAALGVAVAPLPVSAHPEAILRMLDNADAAAVFGDGTIPETETGLAGQRDLAAFVASAQALPPRAAQALPHDLLFDIVYSSGTTGAPKGIEHDIRFRDRQVQRFAGLGFSRDSVALFSTPLYSNTTLATLIPALALGATVILMRRFDELDYLRLAELHGVTHSMMVPVQIRRLVEHPDFARFDLSRFQVKLSTSAPLPPAVTRQVLDRWPGRMVNVYGMTEGGLSAALDCGAFPDKLHTVGRINPGAEVRVIDDAGNPLPPGATGEVVGRSTTMMTGYRRAPEATRAAVWTSPEGHDFIRSGDMGRVDEDGFLVLLDRRRDIIISGGFNVFATDIEAVLGQHPDVAEAAVIGVPSARWGETPVACVVLRSDAAGDPAAVMHWANARLGKTQRLTAITQLDALPRGSIGKVLKRDLREAWGAIIAQQGGRNG